MEQNQLSCTDEYELVREEIAALLTRCEAAGLSRERARDVLHNLTRCDALEAYAEAKAKREEQAAQTPAGVVLQKAFEFGHRRAELRRLGISPPETPEFDALCAEYLRLAHGVAVGDTIEIHGWVKPRTIVLKSFRLSFDCEKATEGFMWFEGDPVRNCPRNRAFAGHGCSLNTWVRKV